MERKNDLLLTSTNPTKPAETPAATRSRSTTNPTVILINTENSHQYANEVLAWLKSDFEKLGQPARSFFHNSNTIAAAFAKNQAIVAVIRKKVVGFMIWSGGNDSCSAEIDIVEVKTAYRRKGIFTGMLTFLGEKFTGIHVLTARPIPEADHVYKQMGWHQALGVNVNQKESNLYYKIIRPVAPALPELPDGVALAVFSKADVPTTTEYVDAYKVIKEPEKYPKRYFNLDLNQDGKLRLPVIIPFHYEGYVGLYHNKKLIAEGKPKHLFEDCHYTGGLLTMDKLKPKDKQLSITTLFSKVDSNTPAAAASSSVMSKTAEPVISAESGEQATTSVAKKDEKKRPSASSSSSSPPAKKSNMNVGQRADSPTYNNKM